MTKKTVILGGGISALSLGYFLIENGERGEDILIIEKEKEAGGLCRSFNNNGFIFDIGPHHFRPSNEIVRKIWYKFSEFRELETNVKIINNGKIYGFPLNIKDIKNNSGLIELIGYLISYLHSKITIKETRNLESWVSKRYGYKIYSKFFKDYTRKVVGVDPKKISSEWVKYRLKNLSLKEVIFSSKKINDKLSLSKTFIYPKKGGCHYPYKKLYEYLKNKRIKFLFNSKANKIIIKKNKVEELNINNQKIKVKNLISTIPIDELLELSDELKKYKDKLLPLIKYRNHIVISLVGDGIVKTKTQNYYVHDPSIPFVRVSIMNNYTLGDTDKTSFLVELFSDYDDLWRREDKYLFRKASELIKNIFDIDVLPYYKIVRSEKAYPVYTLTLNKIKGMLKEISNKYSNLYLHGRAGNYRYLSMEEAIVLSNNLAKELKS